MNQHDHLSLIFWIYLSLILIIPTLCYNFGAFVLTFVFLRCIQKTYWLTAIFFSLIAMIVYFFISIFISVAILAHIHGTQEARDNIRGVFIVLPYIGAIAIYIKAQYSK